MTDRKEQQSLHELSQPADSEAVVSPSFPARRRFVKSTALALPAIMTLHSGVANAQAMASSCRARAGGLGDGAVPSGVAVVIIGKDTYMRQSVPVYDQNNNGTPTYYYDKLQNVWRDYNGGVNLSLNKQPSDATGPLTGDYNALGFVDGSGNVIALGPGYNHSAAESAACFASII